MMNDRKLHGATLSRRDILALAGVAALAGPASLPAFAQEAAKKGGVLKAAAPRQSLLARSGDRRIGLRPHHIVDHVRHADRVGL